MSSDKLGPVPGSLRGPHACRVPSCCSLSLAWFRLRATPSFGQASSVHQQLLDCVCFAAVRINGIKNVHVLTSAWMCFQSSWAVPGRERKGRCSSAVSILKNRQDVSTVAGRPHLLTSSGGNTRPNTRCSRLSLCRPGCNHPGAYGAELCGFDRVTPTTDDAEHLLVGLLAVATPSFLDCLFRPFATFKGAHVPFHY